MHSFLFLYFSDDYFEYSGNSLKEGETTHKFLDIEVPGNGTLTSKTITLFDVFGKLFEYCIKKYHYPVDYNWFSAILKNYELPSYYSQFFMNMKMYNHKIEISSFSLCLWYLEQRAAYDTINNYFNIQIH